MIKKLPVSLFILLLILPSAQASFRKIIDRTLFNGDKLYEYRLDNGFRVIVVPRHQAKVLTYQTWVDVGSIDERLDPKLKKTGLAHLFEHMMFRGTKKFPDGRFDVVTKRMGSTGDNASTHYYRTNYYSNIPSSQLEALMVVESDRMQNLILSDDLLAKEKGAVVGELNRYLDKPGFAGNKKLMELLFPKSSPFHWTTIGTMEEIKSFTLKEAQYFYQTYYAPNNSTLIVVGDVEPETLMGLVNKYYGKMKTQKVPKVVFKKAPPLKKQKLSTVKHSQATSETVMIAYPITSVNSKDFVALDLLSTHLATGMESVLRKALVDTHVAVSANASTGSMPNLFEFYVLLSNKQKARKAIRIIDQIVKTLKDTVVSEEEFKRALNQEKLGLYGSINNNSSLANWLGEFLMMSGNYMRGFEIIDAYQHLERKDLQRVAKTYLDKNKRAIVIVAPKK